MLTFKENATLRHKIVTTNLIGEDEITGELQYKESATYDSFRLSIESVRDTKDSYRIDGVDLTGDYCEGRSVTLPSWYCTGAKLEILWDASDKPGLFYVLPTVSSRLNLECVFGNPIKGVIISQTH